MTKKKLFLILIKNKTANFNIYRETNTYTFFENDLNLFKFVKIETFKTINVETIKTINIEIFKTINKNKILIN